MTQLYSTGPVSLWVQTQVDFGTWSLLGWGERAPDIRAEPVYAPVKFDLTGDVPSSRMLTGEMATVGVTLVRYSESVLATIQAVARSVLLPGVVRGQVPPGGIGSILDLEGGGFELILLFPHAAKSVYQNAANGAMPAGYYFPSASLDPNDIQPGTTNPKKARLGFTCLPQLDMGEVNEYGTGQLSAYSTDPNDLSEVVGVPWT